MKPETFNLIHRAYEESVEKADDIMGILKNFYDTLCRNSSDIVNEDISQFNTFLKGIHTSEKIREKTFQMTNLVSDISFVIIHIIIWLNSTQNKYMDITLRARRKALESEFSKILSKSYSKKTANIHDRFGLRGIINNRAPKDREVLFCISEYILTILIHKSKKEYDLFVDWVNTHMDDFTKLKIRFVLDLPYKVYRYKDYVNNPKDKGYQSIHYVIAMEMFSPVLPGAEIELQWRTLTMHKVSSDDDYKETRRQKEDAVFTIDDFSKIDMVGFTSYEKENDTDGIHNEKILLDRRISNTLV